MTNKNEVKTSRERFVARWCILLLQCANEIEVRGRGVKRDTRIPFFTIRKANFARGSAVVTYARNAKKDPSPSDLSDLIVVPSPTSSTRYKLSFSPPPPPALSWPPFLPSVHPLFLHVILRVLLRAKTSTRLGRKFHPRIAQLIPRSFPCQPAEGSTTPRRQCVLSKLDTYQSTPHPPPSLRPPCRFH